MNPVRQQRTAWQNLILCVIGLAVGFLYLLQNNSMGWFFLLSFGFFLIMQATPRNEAE